MPRRNGAPTPRADDAQAREASAAAQDRRAEHEFKASMERMVGEWSKALGYEAARENRFRTQYEKAVKSADRDNADGRAGLSSFCRWLDLNSDIFRGIINRLVDVIVGEEITPTAPAKSPAWEAVQYWNEVKDSLDVRGLLSMSELQRMWCREMLVSGDVGIALISQMGDEEGAWVQTFQSELIGRPGAVGQIEPKVGGIFGEGPKGSVAQAGTVEGVELDDYGRAVKYHVCKWDAMGVQKVEGKSFDARDFILLALRDRAGQTRGMPYLASGIERLGRLNDYHQAVQVAATIHAMFAIIWKTAKPAQARSMLRTGTTIQPSSGEAAGASGSSASGGVTRDLSKLGPGVMLTAGADDEVQPLQGSQPVAQFEQFDRSQLRLIAQAAGLPLETAVLDNSRANFSVSRMAELQTENSAAPPRGALVRQALRRLFEFNTARGIAIGRISKPADEKARRAQLDVTWRAPARKIVDQQVEVETAIAAINANLISKDDWIEQHGGNPDQVRLDRQREVQEEAKLGITPKDSSPQSTQSSQRKTGETGSDPGPGTRNPTPQDEPAEEDAAAAKDAA